MPKINFFEPEATPERIHIGLRMIKTVIAVFLCSLVGWLRGQPTFFSMIAAVICMQSTTGKTVEISFNQLLGTVVGGVFGVGTLYIADLTSLQEAMPVYYLVVSLLLIPIIITTLVIKKPSISAFACVVFLSIAVYQLGTASPWIYALQRVLDILMGVVAAFVINLLLPNHTPPEAKAAVPDGGATGELSGEPDGQPEKNQAADAAEEEKP
jgi:uncharacterized membrane protein YgaE (UPF0421/DUF939 family)